MFVDGPPGRHRFPGGAGGLFPRNMFVEMSAGGGWGGEMSREGFEPRLSAKASHLPPPKPLEQAAGKTAHNAIFEMFVFCVFVGWALLLLLPLYS